MNLNVSADPALKYTVILLPTWLSMNSLRLGMVETALLFRASKNESLFRWPFGEEEKEVEVLEDAGCRPPEISSTFRGCPPINPSFLYCLCRYPISPKFR